jgi:hypothetical protein
VTLPAAIGALGLRLFGGAARAAEPGEAVENARLRGLALELGPSF